jgi:hypothetical protein
LLKIHSESKEVSIKKVFLISNTFQTYVISNFWSKGWSRLDQIKFERV